jgi:hypothetical protein
MKKLLIALAVAVTLPIPCAAGDAASPPMGAVKGKVLEVLDGGAFTYLHLKTADGESWAVVRRAMVEKGEQVTIEDPEVMQNFESKALQRKFEFVVFGTLAGAANAAAAPGSAALGPPHAGAHPNLRGGNPPAMPDVDAVKVAKAEGPDARTVAEVNADRLALADRRVTIRARVAKVTPGVMGRNWIHLRDGSGAAADNSDDIVVTSKAEPKVGDVVVANGVVRTDVNLGSGYAYKVLVEDVSFRK